MAFTYRKGLYARLSRRRVHCYFSMALDLKTGVHHSAVLRKSKEDSRVVLSTVDLDNRQTKVGRQMNCLVARRVGWGEEVGPEQMCTKSVE